MDLQMLIKEERAAAEARAERAEKEAARARNEMVRAEAETNRTKAEKLKIIIGMIQSGIDDRSVMKIADISWEELERYKRDARKNGS